MTTLQDKIRNICVVCPDCKITVNEAADRLDALEAQVAALNNALNGFIANSCRVDWPADIYDAAIAAQKGAV